MRGLASVLAADTREPRLCAALRAYAVPSSSFVMQPHEDPLPPLGFLDFKQRGQFEARQAVALGFAGECRRPLLALGSLVSAVEDGACIFFASSTRPDTRHRCGIRGPVEHRTRTIAAAG